MATEQEYDEFIAPALAKVAEQCRAFGMPFVARVEYGEKGDEYCGVTQIGNDEATVSQRLTQLAAHCGGNIDTLNIEAMKRFDCSQSIVLRRFYNES